MLSLIYAITNPAIDPKVGTGEGTSILGSLFSRAIRFALIMGLLVCFWYIMYGGFQLITSNGVKEHVQAAQNKITNAVIGLIVLACTWAIIVLIGKFLGITLLGGPITLPTP